MVKYFYILLTAHTSVCTTALCSAVSKITGTGSNAIRHIATALESVELERCEIVFILLSITNLNLYYPKINMVVCPEGIP